jgi:hypothetical protein
MRIGSDRRKIWHVHAVAQEITIYETVPTLIVVLSAESLVIISKLAQRPEDAVSATGMIMTLVIVP